MKKLILMVGKWSDGSGWDYENDIVSIEDCNKYSEKDGKLVASVEDAILESIIQGVGLDNYEAPEGCDYLYTLQLVEEDNDGEQIVLDENSRWESEVVAEYLNA